MKTFLYWTGWEMELPTSYGGFHLIATAILLTIAVAAAFLLRKTDDRKNRIVLGFVGGFLLLTEVYKIAFHVVVDPYGWGFWGVFPLQLCSVPMYLSLFCAFWRGKKLNAWLYEFLFAFNMFGGMMAFIEPSGINHPIWTLTLHAYIWHMMLIFLGLYLYLSRRVCMDKKGYLRAVIVYIGSCAVAQTFNLIFTDKINCFYISPFVQSPLAVFKDIYASAGWFANMVLLMLGLTIASAVIYYAGYLLRVKTKSKVNV